MVISLLYLFLSVTFLFFSSLLSSSFSIFHLIFLCRRLSLPLGSPVSFSMFTSCRFHIRSSGFPQASSFFSVLCVVVSLLCVPSLRSHHSVLILPPCCSCLARSSLFSTFKFPSLCTRLVRSSLFSLSSLFFFTFLIDEVCHRLAFSTHVETIICAYMFRVAVVTKRQDLTQQSGASGKGDFVFRAMCSRKVSATSIGQKMGLEPSLRLDGKSRTSDVKCPWGHVSPSRKLERNLQDSTLCSQYEAQWRSPGTWMNSHGADRCVTTFPRHGCAKWLKRCCESPCNLGGFKRSSGGLRSHLSEGFSMQETRRDHFSSCMFLATPCAAAHASTLLDHAPADSNLRGEQTRTTRRSSGDFVQKPSGVQALHHEATVSCIRSFHQQSSPDFTGTQGASAGEAHRRYSAN